MMDEPKLAITPKKYTGETSVISMRIPKDIVKDLDAMAECTGRTRNELMSLCLEFALKQSNLHQYEVTKNEPSSPLWSQI